MAHATNGSFRVGDRVQSRHSTERGTVRLVEGGTRTSVLVAWDDGRIVSTLVESLAILADPGYRTPFAALADAIAKIRAMNDHTLSQAVVGARLCLEPGSGASAEWREAATLVVAEGTARGLRID